MKEEPPKVYKAQKGDLVDEMLAQYINVANCPVPIKRLGDGYYLFGTRKIYAKIMNGKLVIRVGGGYMVIEEFIATYAQQELSKMQQQEARAAALEEEGSTGMSWLCVKLVRQRLSKERTLARRTVTWTRR